MPATIPAVARWILLDRGVPATVNSPARVNFMQGGLGRLILLVAVIAAAAFVLQPQIHQSLYSATTPRTVEARGNLSEAERSTIELFERVSPSVVQVVVAPGGGLLLDRDGLPEESTPGRLGTGTGFIWDGAGHVVTNAHVVGNAKRVAIRLTTGEILQADVVGVAPHYDLAVVRINTRGKLPPPIPIGTSSDLKVGQYALAIGNPFGLDQSLTTGVISALKRRMPTSAGREISNVIQTDAAINPGNSGGPLLDSAGRVIGVNTAIISPSGTSAGIGFAIPIDVVNRVVPELIRNGRVPIPGIGVVTASEEISARMGVEGVIIVRTAPGSPAQDAGLRGVDLRSGQLGDVIVGVDGKPVRRLFDLTDVLEQKGVGAEVELTLLRDGSRRTTTVKIIDISRSS
jgi:S1-C subfamily serine protease